MAIRLAVANLSVELPTRRGWVRPVRDVSFTLAEGETLAIVGESGSGKTILSLALLGLAPPGAHTLGEAWLRLRSREGKAAACETENLLAASPSQMRSLRGREIAMIFQEPMTALNPVMRVGSQIAEAIGVHEPCLGKAEIRSRVLRVLEQAAVPEPSRRAEQYPHQLSGGLRQRVMIAMALAAGPGVLIADEPTTALDLIVQGQIVRLLANLRKQLQLSLLFITHDLAVAAQVADRLAVMYAGRIVEQGAASAVLGQPRHPYTEGLRHAALGLGGSKFAPMPGAAPSVDALAPGCTFAPRCPHHIVECDARVPDLLAASEGGEDHRARCILAGPGEKQRPVTARLPVR